MMRRALPWTALALALAAAGCVNLAPDYAQPAPPVPREAWPAGTVPAAADAAAAPDLPLERFFTDPRLLQVVQTALANNRDLRVAALNIERARAQYGLQRAAELPALAATGGVTRSGSSAATAANGRATVNNTFSASLGISAWEIDFFGRLRNLSDAAQETLFASAETRRATQVSLVADVATAWLTLAADLSRLQYARDTLTSQQSSYERTERAHALGAESGLTLAQARTGVDAARADVAGYGRQVQQDRNALELLVGAVVPAPLLPQSQPDADAASLLVAVPAGLPSELLQNRPDVLAAEHTLRGAYANIGAARAAFFPRISLTSTIGSASRELGDLFGNGTGTWSFGPAITIPIFNAGALQSSLDVARITRDINVAQYERTVQVAFREVSDALAARAFVGEQVAAQRSLRDASQRALDLSQARFRTGVDSYLDVQVTQRALYTASQTLITLQLAEQVNRITLYKVMGGGRF